jgi:cell division protein DivIC
MPLIGITMVVLSLAVVVNIGASSLKEKDREYQRREANLESLLASEKDRAAQLEEERILVQTKQNVAKIAREKLGLVEQDEIVIKPRNAE